jgi:multiple sugar transport system permease protein
MSAATTHRVQRQPRPSLSGQKLAQRIGIYVLLVLIALFVLMPMLWMLSTSFKPKSQWFLPDIHWIPLTFTWDNYTQILNNPRLPIVRWFINSTLVATASTLLIQYAGVIFPGLAGVFGVFFLRQFFESIPKELEEAAQIDGASMLQTFYHVVLPLAKPALATLSVITFLASWNDFLWPLLILRERQRLTLPPGLRTLQGAYTSEYGQMMAGAAIVAIPVLILYLFMQRYIVESVATTGLKG